VNGKAHAAPAGTMIVLTTNAGAVFQSSIISGAGEIASAHDLQLQVTDLAAGSTEQQALTAAKQASCVLVLANVLSETALAELRAAGRPVTLVSHRSELDLPAVMHDNRQGIAQLMSFLIGECGRTQPLFIRGDQSQLDAQEREQAFREELMRHALSVPERHFILGSFEPHVATASLTEYLTSNSDFDSIVASDYLMALAALQVLRATGRRVPEDVAVVGFGDGPEAAASGLTTVAADVIELGRRGARQLVAQLPGEQPGVPLRGRTLLSTQLVRRSSCTTDQVSLPHPPAARKPR
jgi:DNA-binding LacI/PurR family transcriptional regulator